MQKVGLRAMVIIAFLSLVCFTVHAKECTMIGGEEANATFVVTHDDGTHSVITYSNGEEVSRTSVGSLKPMFQEKVLVAHVHGNSSQSPKRMLAKCSLEY